MTRIYLSKWNEIFGTTEDKSFIFSTGKIGLKMKKIRECIDQEEESSFEIIISDKNSVPSKGWV